MKLHRGLQAEALGLLSYGCCLITHTPSIVALGAFTDRSHQVILSISVRADHNDQLGLAHFLFQRLASDRGGLALVGFPSLPIHPNFSTKPSPPTHGLLGVRTNRGYSTIQAGGLAQGHWVFLRCRRLNHISFLASISWVASLNQQSEGSCRSGNVQDPFLHGTQPTNPCSCTPKYLGAREGPIALACSIFSHAGSGRLLPRSGADRLLTPSPGSVQLSAPSMNETPSASLIPLALVP